VHSKPAKVSVEQRDRLIKQLHLLIQESPEVLFALLHGSFPQGGPFRDLDVALYLDPAIVHRESFRDYELERGVLWTDAVGVPVDIRLLNDAPVGFRYHALKGMVLFVRDEECLDEFRARTWDDYFDFAPFARRYLREVFGG
jgi:hypothetical protein